MKKKTDNLEKEFELSDRHLEFFTKLVKTHSGITLTHNKKEMIYGRLVRRLRSLQLDSFNEYYNMLTQNNNNELDYFINALTTNLTKFFRESFHFEHLQEELINIIKSKQKRIRIWSSATSSGMEAYSIAMVVHSVIGDVDDLDIKILATDIDSDILKIAVKGRYSDNEIKNIPQKYLKYIEHDQDNHQIIVSEKLKNLISFKYLNLVESWPMKGEFDIIFCRNVVIYFDKETQKKLFNRMADLMKKDGVLYIGYAENLFNICNRFALQNKSTYRRIL